MEYNGADRRRNDRRAATRDDWTLWREGVDNRLHDGERALEKLEQALYPRIAKIDEMHEAMAAVKGGFTVLSWIGKGAKPVLWIIAAVGGVLGIKHFPWP